ncbi:helix-turn-helix domain-containing protein [Bacillus sp. FJAT-27251]|uniref:helix-turn-helix domain-containing protein n=1 Tax=Bacillus sp. FJAT-27251 TaxID=1684142 RepID=UPI0006A7C51D|nr:helix-turn-helix domain-containing protein [Bacillus sp. FJAT-27251]
MTELGVRLKEAREARGLSLEQLQDLTKIQKRYLIGIEEGNYSMMPGKFYVRAFIKQYAEAVGLDPEEIFEQYKDEIPATYSDDLPEQLSRVQSRKSMSPGKSKVLDLLPKVLVGIALAAFVVFVWYLVVQKAGGGGDESGSEGNNPVIIEEPENAGTNDNGEDGGAEEEAANDEEPGTEENAENEEAAEEEQPAQELSVANTSGRQATYELKNADKFELTVNSTGATWVDIRNGEGKSVFQGTLKSDGTDSKEFDFTDQPEATVVVGFVPDTEILVNGEKLEFPSDSTRQDITIRYIKGE